METGCEAQPEPVAPLGTLCVFTRGEEQGVVKNIGETGIPGFGTNDSPSGAYIWAETSAPEGN